MKIKKFILIIFVCLFIFTGCTQKDIYQKKQISKQVNDFIFELACFSLTGECAIENPEKYFYPAELNNFTGRYFFENGMATPLIEKYFPEKKGVIDSCGFYNPYNDNGNWIEDLSVLLEEQRIADELNEMEDALASTEYITNENEIKTKEIEDALDKNKKAIDFAGKNNNLRIMQFDNEIFIPYSKENEKIIIEAVGSEVTRNYYDELFRLIKSENWNISSINNAKLNQTEEYFFESDNFKPSKKTIRTDTEFSKIFYNENGLAVKSENYETIIRKTSKENDKQPEEKTDILVSVYEWSYNENNKVEKEINTAYFYKNDYKKLDYSFEKKHVYMYNDFTDILSKEDNDKIPADFEYFEDGILKMRNKYSAELGTFTSQIFFENDFSVKTRYEKYKRIQDVYTSGKEVVRIKDYE